MPQLVHEVLGHAIDRQADMELMAESSGPARFVNSTAPDVVVVGTAGAGQAEQATRLLWRWPRSHVLMLAVDGHQAALYHLNPERTELGELSPDDVVSSIRQAVHKRRGTSE